MERYDIELTPDAVAHLRALRARDRSIVMRALEVHLAHAPTVETRNRKPTRESAFGAWCLRLGRIRVYYDADEAPERVVRVAAIGLKEHDLVRIGRDWYRP